MTPISEKFCSDYRLQLWPPLLRANPPAPPAVARIRSAAIEARLPKAHSAEHILESRRWHTTLTTVPLIGENA